MNNDYSKVGLYEHNITSYEKVKEAYANGEKVAAIVHATGTGKTYNALQLALDNKDKKNLFVAPTEAIIEHVKMTINDNPNLSMERDFPNLEFRTYQSFINMSRKELSEIDVDLLVLDEFQHLGAPVWGQKINEIIDTHEDMKIFGMTAYTVRDRGTSYERDMALPGGDEVFSDKVVSRYDLVDAMMDGVLPKPLYKCAYVQLLGMVDFLEQKLEEKNLNIGEYNEYKKMLSDVKRKVIEAPGVKELILDNINKDSKIIYFCPVGEVENTDSMEDIKNEMKAILKDFVSEEDMVFYQTTSKMGEEGKKNRDAFYNDMTLDGKSAKGKLRIMFAKNQYNLGVHAPNVDRVILGRATSSDIVYFEQIGRCLAVRGNIKRKFEEYQNYSIEELLKLADNQKIIIKDRSSKEEIIEKLLAPIIIDLSNNIEFIRELENNLKDRVKEAKVKSLKEGSNRRFIRISDTSFDVEVLNVDLFETLRYVRDRLMPPTWEESYKLASVYYEHHGDLEVPAKFRTHNGYERDENGTSLGGWIKKQRDNYKSDNLFEDRIKLLEQIGMRFETRDNELEWQKKYELAKVYYKYHGDLEVPLEFRTYNGYEPSKNGERLGGWIKRQRIALKKENLSERMKRRRKLLEEIGMRFETKDNKLEWQKKYELARIYYEHHGNLKVPQNFRTHNGYEYDGNGTSLGGWIDRQRTAFSKGTLSEERIKLLNQIGMHFETNKNEVKWQEKYELASVYYEHYGDLEVPISFRTHNGYEYDGNGTSLGSWIDRQRTAFSKGTLSEEKIKLLEQIGMRFETKDNELEWQKNYKLASIYYEHHGNLEVPRGFKIRTGSNLRYWISNQRTAYKEGKLSEYRIKFLEQIGMRFETRDNELEWQKKYELARIYYEHHGNLKMPRGFKTQTGSNLESWISNQRTAFKNGTLSEEKIKLLTNIGMIFDTKKNKEEIMVICEEYGIDYKKNKDLLKHISRQELISKILYLNGNNIDITSNGVLHEIFSMSNINMQAKYNLTLEKLVNKYCSEERGREYR